MEGSKRVSQDSSLDPDATLPSFDMSTSIGEILNKIVDTSLSSQDPKETVEEQIDHLLTRVSLKKVFILGYS